MSLPQRASFVPDLCGLRALFAVVSVAQLLAFMLSVARAGFGPLAWPELALMSMYVQWIAMAAAAMLCLTRRTLARLPALWESLLAYVLVLLVAAVVAELAWQVLAPREGEAMLLTIDHGEFAARTLSISAIVAAVVLRYFYVQHHWQERTAAAAAARLQALQARIRPHFLFNCMNTIASLIRVDPQRAERAVEDLSDLLRASLADAGRFVTLAEEFELVHRYLAIEALRLGERLQVVWDIDALPQHLAIPQLSLQPLVENAITHGIELLAAGGVIRIHGRVTDQILELGVANPVPPQGRLSARGNHLAQDNLRQRLAAHFGPAGELRIEQTPNRYCATMRLPAAESPDAHRDR